MLPSALVDNKTLIVRDPKTRGVNYWAYTYICPCRYRTLVSTTKWLSQNNLKWLPVEFGLIEVEFIDEEQAIVFKEKFEADLPERCKH